MAARSSMPGRPAVPRYAPANRLALHVGTHEGAVGVVVLENGTMPSRPTPSGARRPSTCKDETYSTRHPCGGPDAVLETGPSIGELACATTWRSSSSAVRCWISSVTTPRRPCGGV
jgi:hypothetical protein